MNPTISGIIETLEQRKISGQLQKLNPTKIWHPALEKEISQLRLLSQDTAMITLIAALHLHNDSLDTSHSYAQQIEHDITGAYWHGIMHRMEEDYWNAKYWFNQASNHPISRTLKEQIASFLKQDWDSVASCANEKNLVILQSFQNNGWDSGQFVDLVQSISQAKRLTPELEAFQELVEQIQAIEIDTLFQFTLEQVSYQ